MLFILSFGFFEQIVLVPKDIVVNVIFLFRLRRQDERLDETTHISHIAIDCNLADDLKDATFFLGRSSSVNHHNSTPRGQDFPLLPPGS